MFGGNLSWNFKSHINIADVIKYYKFHCVGQLSFFTHLVKKKTI